MSSPRFSKDVALILENADRKIRHLSGGNHHLLYHFWHATMEKVCRVDSFYVGYFREDNRFLSPYTYDETGYDDPEEITYGEHGLCAWIRRNRRTYTYSLDNGALLHNGQRFGDLTRTSADCVVIPLLEQSESTSQVIGMASMQSYKSNSYTSEAVRAFQWLARSISTVLLREREDAICRLELGVASPSGLGYDSSSRIADEINRQLRVLRQMIQRVQMLVPWGQEVLDAALRDLNHECEQVQTNTMDLLIQPQLHSDGALGSLTSREREVANLIAQGLSNDEIAIELSIALSTVKKHVSSILEKLEVKQRSAVTMLLKLVRGERPQ